MAFAASSGPEPGSGSAMVMLYDLRAYCLVFRWSSFGHIKSVANLMLRCALHCNFDAGAYHRRF